VGIGALLEIDAQGRDRFAEAAHPSEQEPAVSPVLRVGRLEDEEEIERVERGWPVPPRQMGGLQVSQHAGEDLAAAGRPQHSDMEQDAVADRAPDERLAVVGCQRPAAIGGIEQQPVGTADDEMTRQADPDERQAKTRGDLELDDREADRKADATRDHLVEMAVRRVAVLGGGRPAVAELAIQDVVEASDDLVCRIAGVEADPDPLGDRVHRSEDLALVDGRTAQAGDQERADREVDLRLRPGDEAGEPGAAGRSAVVEPGALVVHARDSRHRCQPRPGARRIKPGRGDRPLRLERCGTRGRLAVGCAIPSRSLGDDVAAMPADSPAPTIAPGLGPLRAAPAGLPEADLAPPVVAESGDPFAALRVIGLLARIERGRPVRLADIVDRLNATNLDWLFPVTVVADVAVALQSNWMTDYRNSSGIELGDGPYGPTIEIEDSSRVDPWIVRQADRQAAACRERLAAFSRLDRPTGEG
jgi:hypothetical protein